MPWRETGALARHFLQGLFRLNFLDDAGEESFRRVIIGLLAGFLAFGSWLPRLFARKYFYLGQLGQADVYLQALQADQLLMLCLPMFVVAMAMALVCQSLFPDETDYRILMALPVSRAAIFSAKLLALLAFASIFIITTNVAIGVPFAAISTGPLNPHYWPVRAVAQVAAGLLGAIFAAGSVIALQGLVSIATPRGSLRSIAVLMQTALVCALVLVVPILARVPTQGALLRAQPAWLSVVPPVWFLGLEETLLGSRDPYFVRLAELAISGTAAVGLMAALCYGFVYRRFDRVILRTEKGGKTSAIRRFRGRPEYAAVRAFTTATLHRSGLHQIVCLSICAAGLALTINNQDVLRAPLVLMFAAVLGLRAALLLPVTRQAAWVFRITENETRRRHQLAAVEHFVLECGVLVPMLITFPIQVKMLGWTDALVALPLTAALGILLVEIALLRWHRIPFTCTYLPGKRPVAHTFLLLLLSFSFFTAGGGALLSSAAAHDSTMPVAIFVFAALAAAFRLVRTQTNHNRPLEFEDELPESTYGLQLNS